MTYYYWNRDGLHITDHPTYHEITGEQLHPLPDFRDNTEAEQAAKTAAAMLGLAVVMNVTSKT